MFLDVRYGRNYPWEVTIYSDAGVYSYRRFRPFFYLIVRSDAVEKAKAETHHLAKTLLESDESLRRNRLVMKHLKELLSEPVEIAETGLRAIVYDPTTCRYTISSSYTVLRVTTHVPQHVKVLATSLKRSSKLYRVAAHNIKYPCRFTLSNPWVKLLDITPLYYIFDPDEVLEGLSKLTYVVYDVEWLEDKKTWLVSLKVRRLMEPVDYSKELSDVQTFEIRTGGNGQIDELVNTIEKLPRVFVGYHNGKTPREGYDNPQLIAMGVPESLLWDKVLIDLLELLKMQAQALGIGTAAMGLADVVFAIKDKAKLPDELIDMKLRAAEMLTDVESAKIYNKTDIVITSALAELLLPYGFGLAAITQLPPYFIIHELRSGMIFEYALVKWLEIHGFMAEARPVSESPRERDALSGQKVFTFMDVERMIAVLRDIPRASEKIERLQNALIEALIQVADRLEGRLEKEHVLKILEEKRDILREIVRIAKAVADYYLKNFIKRKKSMGETVIKRVIKGPIVHKDVEMMYPTEILKDKVDPCALVTISRDRLRLIAIAEDVKYDVDRLPAPFYSFAERLYRLRNWVKSLKKQAPTPDIKNKFDTVDKAVKAIVNAMYGSMSKGSGDAHFGHAVSSIKIFRATIRDQLTLVIASKLTGLGTPIYSDTDSVFISARPESVKVKQLLDKIGIENYVKVIDAVTDVIAREIGYGLSLEGVYDEMFCYGRKTYAVRIRGQMFKPKGQLLGRLKHITTPIVRATVLEALKHGTVKVLIDALDKIDDVLLLVPSLSKAVVDLVVMSVEEQKRATAQGKDLSWRLRVIVGRKGDTAKGLLKEISPQAVPIARLAALFLKYGVKRSGDYIVDLTKFSPKDILDLRALPLITSSERLSGRYVLALDRDNVPTIVALDYSSVHYILQDVRTGDIVDDVPVRYRKYSEARRDMRNRLYRVVGIRGRLHVVRRTDISEVRKIVRETVYHYLMWSGLSSLLEDVEDLRSPDNTSQRHIFYMS